MARENLFEAVMQPDVMAALTAHTNALNTLSSQMKDLTAMNVLGGSGGSGGSGTSGDMRLSLPISFADLLQTMIAGYPQDVTPFYTRDVTLVPAGQTIHLSDPTPDGEVGAVVYEHVMSVDYFSKDILITHQQDNEPAVVAAAPAIAPITVLGTFLRPVKYAIRHTVVNNTEVDVNFVDNVQAAIMSHDFVQEVWNPFLKGQVDLIKGAATAFKAVNL